VSDSLLRKDIFRQTVRMERCRTRNSHWKQMVSLSANKWWSLRTRLETHLCEPLSQTLYWSRSLKSSFGLECCRSRFRV